MTRKKDEMTFRERCALWLEKTNFYGYDGETYEDCAGLIRSTNLKHLAIINAWFMLINLAYLAFSLMNLLGVGSDRAVVFIAYLVVGTVFEAAIHYFQKFTETHLRPLVYAHVVFLLIYGIEASLAQPYMSATMILVLMVLVAFSYIDTMFRTVLILTVSAAIFLGSSYANKVGYIANQDALNTGIYLVLAVILHYSFQRTRMEQFVTLHKNIRIHRELLEKGNFDALTELLARGLFFDMAAKVLADLDKRGFTALVLIDLDHFKEVNDELGHQVGDLVIKTASSVILSTLEVDYSEKWNFPETVLETRGSFAGRLGGDEFIAIIRGARSKASAMDTLDRLLSELNSTKIEGLSGIRASIGVTELKVTDGNVDEAYKRADDALYSSKRHGKNRISYV